MKTKGSKSKTKKKTAAKRSATKPSAAKKLAGSKAAPKKKASPKKVAAKSPKAKPAAKAKASAKPSKAKPAPKTKPSKSVKVTARVVEVATPKAPPAPVVEAAPATPTPVTPAAVAAAPKPKAVLRIAGGRVRGAERTATNGSAASNGAGNGFGPHAVMGGVTADSSLRMPPGRLEVNPRLESTRGKIKTPPPAAMVNQSTVKGMSVAEKRRAEAEAMFQQYAKPGQAPTPAPAAPVSAPGQNGSYGAPAGVDEYGRFSHRDSLMTMLRMAAHRSQALEAANELADKYKLPADQGLLLKVLDLGEARLTKLALEELIELDDRGRVRPNDQLRSSLAAVETKDVETQELKDLLMAKVGVRV